MMQEKISILMNCSNIICPYKINMWIPKNKDIDTHLRPTMYKKRAGIALF